MRSADFIYTCWEKEQKSFNKNLSVLKNQPEKEAVHDLRVTVKKLRASMELYMLISEKQLQENLLKETEQLFGIMGKQRDIEICLEIIDTSEKENGSKYRELKNYFLALLPLASEWTKKAVKHYDKKELPAIALLLKHETPSIEEEELKHKIASIIHTHLATCKNCFNKPHKLRQGLKEIYYWIKMIPETLFPGFEIDNELHAVLDDFGNWQNLTVFALKLKHYRKDYLPKTFPEYASIKMLETIINERKEKLLTLSLHKTSSLLKKATATEKARLDELS